MTDRGHLDQDRPESEKALSSEGTLGSRLGLSRVTVQRHYASRQEKKHLLRRASLGRFLYFRVARQVNLLNTPFRYEALGARYTYMSLGAFPPGSPF